MKKGKHEKSNKASGRIIFFVLLAVFIATGSIALYNIIVTNAQYTAAQQEYTILQEYAPQAVEDPGTEPADETKTNDKSDEPVAGSSDSHALSDLNPDYIGWIRIDGTGIDYPVVQSADNEKYQRLTFRGEKNASGTIFMDNRCTGGFKGLSILYGHNMRDGSMFADLHRFSEEAFLEAYPDVMIFDPDGEILIFRIFEVKITHTWDPVFTLPDSNQEAVDDYFAEYGLVPGCDILILSTCTKGAKSERLLVIAERST